MCVCVTSASLLSEIPLTCASVDSGVEAESGVELLRAGEGSEFGEGPPEGDRGDCCCHQNPRSGPAWSSLPLPSLGVGGAFRNLSMYLQYIHTLCSLMQICTVPMYIDMTKKSKCIYRFNQRQQLMMCVIFVSRKWFTLQKHRLFTSMYNM